MNARRRHGRAAIIAASYLFVAGLTVAYGCGDDDSVAGDDAGPDSGSASDGTAQDSASAADSALPSDSASPIDATSDTGVDAGPSPHVVFVTSALFDGDLTAIAASIVRDAGADASLFDNATDAGSTYLAAGDAICQRAANAAGLHGTFATMVTAGADQRMSRFTDSDGPWARVDGVPVADTIADLTSGRWYAPIDIDENGAQRSASGSAAVWSGHQFADCQHWTTNTPPDIAQYGEWSLTSSDALSANHGTCDQALPLFCAQVGAGGVPNMRRAVPAGGKLAFPDLDDVTASFALADAGVLTATPPDAGDPAHSVADAVCNQFASNNGLTGKFHAWISTSDADAKTFFAAHGMNGPWYRPDGLELAASLSELLSTGPRVPIEISPDGGLVDDLNGVMWTGTENDGTLIDNCNDFTGGSSPPFGRGTEPCTVGAFWTDYNPLSCSGEAGFYCFEE